MNPDLWGRVKGVFHAALEQPAASREAFVQTACAGDDELVREVQSLLTFHERADTFIEEPALAAGSAEPGLKGRRIGPYLLTREIGRGGMGTVYLAGRAGDEFQQQVAVKLVKRGLDTDFIVERFKAERQILAGLDHPHIARLLDGGTTDDGLHYFVMEYVQGERIDAFCERNALAIDERLALFRDVCSAVQYAHQNLVVHRDIKPGNILVTESGTVKLLDFGLAKLLTGGGPEATVTGFRMMTPEYASPEQVRGGPITTATDIYSLGVVLYELLTGQRPYRPTDDSPVELIRLICDREPDRPSAAVSRRTDGATAPAAHAEKLRRQLEGDLDNIVLMAMRKEPHLRYLSAAQLAEDIRRHLARLPVIARKPTLGYRTSKFVRRNRVGVAAAGLTAGTLVAGIVATLRQARVARAERARAERRFEDTRTLANSLLFEVHDMIAELPGATAARELIIKRALSYLDRLAREADDDSLLWRELAEAYIRIGHIQGNTYYSNLADTDGAFKSYRTALGIYESQLRDAPDDEAVLAGLAGSHEGLGDMLYTVLDLPGARDAYQKALVLRERLAAAEPEDSRRAYLLARVLGKLGDIHGGKLLAHLGDFARSLEYHKRSLALRETLHERVPENREYRSDHFNGVLSLAGVRWAMGDLAGASETYGRGLRLAAELCAAEPGNAEYRRDVALAQYMVGLVNLERPGYEAEAIEQLRRSLGMVSELSHADPDNARADRELAVLLNQYGRALARAGRTDEALANIREALAIFERLHETDPENPENLRDMTIATKFIGDALAAAGAGEQALEAYEEALALSRRLFAERPSDRRLEWDLGVRLLDVGTLRGRLGDAGGAVEALRECVAVRERAARENACSRDAMRDLAVAYGRLAGAVRLCGEPPDGDASRELQLLRGSAAALWSELDRHGYEPGLFTRDRAEAVGGDPDAADQSPR